MVGLSPNVVSQAINECAGVNFFDFVNRYRVEEAKRLLEEAAKSDASDNSDRPDDDKRDDDKRHPSGEFLPDC